MPLLGEGSVKSCCNNLCETWTWARKTLNLETLDVSLVAPVTLDGASAAQIIAKITMRNPNKRIIHVIRNNAGYRKRPTTAVVYFTAIETVQQVQSVAQITQKFFQELTAIHTDKQY